MLGYSSPFVPRCNPVDENLEAQSTWEMAETYAREYKLDKDKNNDTLYWKRASFLDLCFGSMKNCYQSKKFAGCIYHLLSFCKTKNFFMQYCRPAFIGNSKAYWHSLEFFDTIVNQIVCSIQINLNASDSNNKNSREMHVSRTQEDLHLMKQSHRTYYQFVKEWTLPNETATPLKYLVLNTGVNLPRMFLQIFKKK